MAEAVSANAAGDQKTRHQRVKDILNAAAGTSAADYGGIGRFWELSAAQLKTLKLEGVPLIAPEAPASCCEPAASRGAASGLIKGLRGEAPFDGGRLPPLPWGGSRVADPDIDFIAEWIDDGCPSDDHLSSIAAARLESPGDGPAKARLADVTDLAVFAEGVNRRARRPGEPRQRANLDCLSEAQIERLRGAFRHLYDLNAWPEDRRSYNNQALIHQNHCQHGWERFLPWHRAYLYEFEQNLQDFEPDLTLPYWDWTMPQYRPEEPETGWIIPPSLRAFLTEEQAEWLVGVLDPAPTPAQKAAFLALGRERRHFTSQHRFFCHVIETIGYQAVTPDTTDQNRRRMIDALLASNALWYPLRYPAEYKGGGTIRTVIHYHYPSAGDMEQILALNNFRDFGGGSIYNAAFGFLDQNPHNTMHIWTGGQNPDQDSAAFACKTVAAAAPGAEASPSRIGARRNAFAQVSGRLFHSREDLYSQPGVGDMFSNLTASYDPVFWPIHVNVDRIWWEWQKRNPNGLPDDLDAVLSPWSYTIRDMLSIDRFGYEYVRGSFFMPVGLEAPIARFLSTPIRVDEKIKAFRKAEIRLHSVPQLMRSCFIRAFLNQPDADAATPVHDNPHFAGYLAVFGHGGCYGGPGHCDLPPAQSRDYDRRPRSHNTPRNHRIDVTQCARRLLETADSLQITLLVIGVDYQEESDLLKLEGVSLNFLD
jgi:tyrosinase